MTWDELFKKLGKAGITYVGVDEDEDGFIVISTDLKERRNEDGDLVLVREER